MNGRRLLARGRASRAGLADAALAAVLVAVGQVDVWAPSLAVWGDDPVQGPPLPTALLLVGVAAPVAWRRRAPLAAVAVTSVAAAAQALLPGTPPIGLLLSGPVLVGLYSVAAYAGRNRALAGLAVTGAAVAVHDLDTPAIRTAQGFDDAAFWWLVLLAGWIVGRYVGSRRAADALGRRTRELERQRLEALTAVQEERARIARELHDVVAHSVSVVAVQAGAALAVLDDEPARAREPLAAIETTARSALEEMRRLLGVLRAEDTEPSMEPQPGLGALGALARQVSAAGLPVDLVVEGTPEQLPPGLDLAAYRIVQEALTNALKHSGASRAAVTVTYRPDSVGLRVTDDGAGPSSARSGGHGLVGMRERAGLYGGALTVGPRPGGGYEVSAVLPRTGGTP